MSNYEFSNLACWGESQREEAESETSGRGAVQNSHKFIILTFSISMGFNHEKKLELKIS